MAAKGVTNLKLYYFNMKGRAEHIRYLLSMGELVFEDYRVKDDWPTLKPEMPFGSMPVLEVTTGGKKERIGTSLSAGRLAAKLVGLYGSTPMEQAHIDAIVDLANDIREDSISMFAFKSDPKEKEEGKKQYCEKVEVKLGHLEKLLKDKYFVGNKISWADIHFYAQIEVVEDIEKFDLLKNFPKLQNLYKEVGSNPKIIKYQKSRPK